MPANHHPVPGQNQLFEVFQVRPLQHRQWILASHELRIASGDTSSTFAPRITTYRLLNELQPLLCKVGAAEVEVNARPFVGQRAEGRTLRIDRGEDFFRYRQRDAIPSKTGQAADHIAPNAKPINCRKVDCANEREGRIDLGRTPAKVARQKRGRRPVARRKCGLIAL